MASKGVLSYISGVFHQHDSTPVKAFSKRTEQQRGLRSALGTVRQSKRTAKAAMPKAKTIEKIPGFKAYKKKSMMPEKAGYTAGRILKNGKVEVQGYRNKITGEFIEFHTVDVPDMIYSLDRSIFGDSTPYSDAFYRATAAQREQIIERMHQINWNTFWKYQFNYDPAKGGLTTDGQVLLDWIFEGIEVEEITATPLGTSSQLWRK